MKTLLLLSVFFSSQLFAYSMTETLGYLSNDKLQGRRAGTVKNLAATTYLKEVLAQYQLKPLGDKYLQEFTIFTKMVKNGDNLFEDINLKRKVLFEPVAFSASGEALNSEMVFVGFGITLPASENGFNYDDYQNIDVKNKTVILFTGDPGIGNPDSPFRDPDLFNYRTLFFKLKNAAKHGAKAVLIINNPLSIDDIENEPLPYFNETDGGGKRIDTLAGYTTNIWFNNYLANSEYKNTTELQKALAKKQTPLSFKLNTRSNILVNLKKETGRVSNVLGVIEGSDPLLKREVIIIGAHFDHLGFGGQSSMDPGNEKKIHNGADDNASGTSLVLELAKMFKHKKPKRTLIFSFFNAEELGLLGSAHFVSSWNGFTEKYGNLYAMINFDMVGRFQKSVSIMGLNSAFEWNDLLSQLIPQQELPYSLKKRAVGSSDHASFIQSKIPALFFTTGAHEDYHRSTDTMEKIDFNSMAKISKTAEVLLDKISNNTLLTFNPEASEGDSGRNRGYGAHLGCVPQFGQSDDIIGVLCTRTVPGSPANRAGVIDNDVITQIGDIEIKSIYDLAFALKYYRAGDEVQLGWDRAGQSFSVKIKLVKRESNNKGMHSHGCHVEIY